MKKTGSLIPKALFDLSRQGLTTVPILFFFLTSKSTTYISLTIFTSALTVVCAIFVMGLNIVLLLPRNKSLFAPILRWGHAASIASALTAFMIITALNAFPNFNQGPLFCLVAGEAIYSTVLLLLSRYSIAQNLTSLAIFTNIVTPAIRALVFLGFVYPNSAEICAVLYLLLNLGFALTLSYRFNVFSESYFNPLGSRMREIVVRGIPIWLSSLGVTLIDNLSVFFIVAALGPTHSPNLLFTLRVFAVLSIPVQSFASARLARVAQSKNEERRAAISVGILTSIIGVLGISLFDYSSQGSFGELTIVGLSLCALPVFRGISTIMGNYLTFLDDQLARALIVGLSLITLLIAFGLLQEFLIDTLKTQGIIAILLLVELFMALMTSLRTNSKT